MTPPNAVVPWTPHQAHRQIKLMQDHYRKYPDPDVTADRILGLVATQLETMRCPHGECFHCLLDHDPLPEHNG